LVEPYTLLCIENTLFYNLSQINIDGFVINLNFISATVEKLAKVLGLNKDMAEKTIAVREENGEFVDMDELLDIDNVDVKLLRQLKNTLKPKVRIKLNSGIS
jgi:DNA uptake protein ComE-like DNA-binding protein